MEYIGIDTAPCGLLASTVIVPGKLRVGAVVSSVNSSADAN